MLSLAPSRCASATTSPIGFRRERRVRQQDHRHRRDQPDRGEVLGGIEAGIGIEAWVDRHRSGMAEKQRVPVGMAPDERARPDQPRAAGAVVDHDLLAERARELLGNDARHGVDAAARRIGDDEVDGPRRIVRRPRIAENAKRRQRAAKTYPCCRGECHDRCQSTQHFLPIMPSVAAAQAAAAFLNSAPPLRDA